MTIKLDPKLPNLFVDMDGTIARFYDDPNYLQTMYLPGYYRNLMPYDAALHALRQLSEQKLANILILSTYWVDTPNTKQEKLEWLEEHMADIPHIPLIYQIPCDKAEKAVEFLGRPLKPTDVLFDDHTRYLKSWENAGGTGIKAVNHTQNKPDNASFAGLRLEVDSDKDFVLNTLVYYLTKFLADNHMSITLSYTDANGKPVSQTYLTKGPISAIGLPACYTDRDTGIKFQELKPDGTTSDIDMLLTNIKDIQIRCHPT